MSDDYTSTIQTTGAVTVGGQATGEIESAYDVDWFAVTLQAGTYTIDLEGSGANALYDPYLYGIYNAGGELLANSQNDNGGFGAGYNSRLTFTVTQEGTYYIAAGGDRTDTGAYTLSVEEFTPPEKDDGDDYAAWATTTGTVAVGSHVTGNIESRYDLDWFAMTLQAGKTYIIDLEGSPTQGGSLSDTYLRGVHDSNGNLISGTTNDDGGAGRNSRLVFTATEDGIYYAVAGAYTTGTGTYTLSVTEVADDYAAGTDTTGTVTVGSSATGEIETAGDRDWFAVTLEAGKSYRIELAGSGADALADPHLRGVHDSDGALIYGTTDDNGGEGNNSRLVFTAAEAGTWYVAAGAASGTGGYTLSVTDISNDDYAAGTGTTGTVAVGGSATGDIGTWGDRDWFAVTLEAGKSYRIDLEGSPTGGGTLSDTYLRGVHDTDGNLISGTVNDDDGAGRNSRLVFTATEDGTYYVAAGAWGSYTGSYTLSVTEVAKVAVPSDDYAAGTGTTGTVAVGGSATGEIESWGDRDWFAVTLEAGQSYRIDLEGSRTNAGSLYDPYLRGVHDSDGNLISGTTNDDSGSGLNSRLAFTAAEAGTYYVAAGAWGSNTGSYTLSVEEAL